MGIVSFHAPARGEIAPIDFTGLTIFGEGREVNTQGKARRRIGRKQRQAVGGRTYKIIRRARH